MQINRLIVLLLIIASCPAIKAQKTNSAYLFADFQSAKVYFSNGQQANERVNYHLLSNKIRFIDRKDQQVKEVSDTKVLDSIVVGKRVFIPNPDQEGWMEILSAKPVVQVQYFVKGKTKGQEAAYGGTSELASTKSYSEYRDGGTFLMPKVQEMEVASYYNYYWIVKDGKRKQFKSLVQFVKLYPNQKDQLNKYIQDNAVKFEDTEAIVKLCCYAENL